MVKTIVTAVMALASAAAAGNQYPAELTITAPIINAAPAAVNEVIVGGLPVPDLPETVTDDLEPDQGTDQEMVQEFTQEFNQDSLEIQASEEDFYSEPAEDLPTPADEFAYSEMQPLGTYHITHYSLEECGNCIGAAEVPGGMVQGLSCAMPERWMLGRTVLIEGYGFFRVDDISPDGIADIFHYDAASAVGEDWQMVYLVE